MSSQNQYINVLRAPSGPLSFNVYLKSRNNPTVVDLTVPILIPGAMDTNSAAAFICTTLNAAFTTAGIYYGDIPTGTPQFITLVNGYYHVIPRAWVCDHYVNIWAQAQFSLSISPVVSTASSGTKSTGLFTVNDGPVYVTLDEADQLHAMFGVKWASRIEKSGFTELDKVNNIVTASNTLRAIGGWAMTASQYLDEFGRVSARGCSLRYTPIVAADKEIIGGAIEQNILNAMSPFPRSANINYSTGRITFIGWDRCRYPVGAKITYIGGLPTIDQLLKDETMRLSRIVLQPERFLELKGGTGSAKLATMEDIYKDIKTRLVGLLGRRG